MAGAITGGSPLVTNRGKKAIVTPFAPDSGTEADIEHQEQGMNETSGRVAPGLALLIASLILTMSTGAVAAEEKGVAFEIQYHHVGLSVPNAEESAAWYGKMLEFEIVTSMTQGADMKVAHIRRATAIWSSSRSPAPSRCPTTARTRLQICAFMARCTLPSRCRTSRPPSKS